MSVCLIQTHAPDLCDAFQQFDRANSIANRSRVDLSNKRSRVLVLLQLEYRRSKAESIIAETLDASPKIADAETLLAEVYRLTNRRTEAS